MTTSAHERAAYEGVAKVALAVAYVMNNHAECIAGVALLQATAELFGYQLQPRAVSMFAQNQNLPGVPTVATGRLAQDFARSLGMPEATAYVAAAPDGSEFQRAGHLVAVLEHPNVVIDPTFGQFSKAGFPDVVPCEAIDSSQPTWQIEPVPGVGVLYIVDDANEDWQESYRVLFEEANGHAVALAEHIRGGGAPHGVPFRMS